jgi:hypothetical protein
VGRFLFPVRRNFYASRSDSCNRIENGVDARFRTFVKNLDPDDKAIQACFQSLVQVCHPAGF